MPSRSAHSVRRRPPFFQPVSLRARADGWTEERQCAFLAQLYWTGSVMAAARGVGMSRASAYRLRERTDAAGFADAWDAVLTPPSEGRIKVRKVDWRKVTLERLTLLAETGLVRPILYRGSMVAIRRKPHSSALLRLLRRVVAGNSLRQARTGKSGR